MVSPYKDKKPVGMLAFGIIGCLLMGAGDYLMIYGDTACEGQLAWLTLGAAAIPQWRNGLAMVLAFPAVIFYFLGLIAVRHFIPGERQRKNYSALTALGMTPWLSLHLFYIMILFAFGYLMSSGESTIAYSLCESMFGSFAWLIIAGEVLMLLPFLYLTIVILRGGSIFKKSMAVNNPLTYYIILKLITMLMPDVPFRLGFTNALMSEAMLIWFAVFIIASVRQRKKEK